ncbi:MAG: RNase adapter RapZ, partial [Acidobacteriota bacterium]
MPGVARIAVVTDVRSPGVADELPSFLNGLDRSRVEPVLLFLDTSDEILVRRYSETRRRHPLAEGQLVIEGIRRERDLLGGLRGAADRVIDTTELTIHEIRAELVRDFGDEHAGLTVTLVTFGFKRGIPYGTDMLFDVRFLPNPYFVEGLRERPGTDPKVVHYLESQSSFHDVVDRLRDLLEDL